MAVNQWQDPTGSEPQKLYSWAQQLMQLFRRGYLKDYDLIAVTLSAGTSTVVTAPNVTDEAKIFLNPTSSAAAAIRPYRTATSVGASFTLTHSAAAGTETYDCLVIR